VGRAHCGCQEGELLRWRIAARCGAHAPLPHHRGHPGFNTRARLRLLAQRQETPVPARPGACMRTRTLTHVYASTCTHMHAPTGSRTLPGKTA
jgi:hypothetical protein